jgi:IS5 family transposase
MMKSRVHPKYKTKYRVSNWAEYDRALVQRGDITLWISEDAIASWKPAPTGRRGAQRKFADHAIETALTLRFVFRLPLRQAEGFLRSVLSLMGLDLDAPDHTTLSRRGQHLDIKLRRAPTSGAIHLIVDSTGLSIVGEGEWAAAKHGGKGKRGWKKLHLGVDRSGVIVAQVLTDGNADDAMTGLSLIDEVGGDIASFTADAAYDTIAIYDAATARGAKVVVPPTRTAAVSRRRPRSTARDRTIKKVKKIGRRRWKNESGYHRQARVENVFFRYKSMIGDRLRARHPKSQEAEAMIACNILNRMTELGRPASNAIGA